MSTTLMIAGSGMRAGVPQDPESVRSTVTVVQDDAPPSVAPAAPDYNQVMTDPETEGGLTSHDLASAVTPSVQYVPNMGNANDVGDAVQARVNDTISTGGTAAAREASGEWGHGTMQIVQGIEPTLVDGHQFGSDYFAAENRPEMAAGAYMSATQSADPAVQSTGEDNSRDAVQQSQGAAAYQTVLNALLNGGAVL